MLLFVCLMMVTSVRTMVFMDFGRVVSFIIGWDMVFGVTGKATMFVVDLGMMFAVGSAVMIIL